MTISRLGFAGQVGHRAKTMAPRRVLIVLLVATIVLSPSIRIIEGFYQPRSEDFILIVAAPLWLLSSRQGVTARPNESRIPAILAAMCYMAVISICVGAIAFEQNLSLSDWMILPMIVRYWLIFQLGQSIRQKTELRMFLWTLMICMGVGAGIGVLQHFNLLGINDWLTPLYIRPHMQLLGLEWVKAGLSGARVVGTHGDPRLYAYILVVGTALCLAILLNLRGWRVRIATVVVMTLCLMGIGFTASRTGVLGIVVVFLATAVIQRQGLGGTARVAGILLVTIVLLAAASSMTSSPILQERVLGLEDESFDTSYDARERDLIVPFQQALENPIIWITGRGPSKAAIRTDSHNDFGWYFLRFGLPGLLLYLALLIYPLRLTLRARSEAGSPIESTVIMLVSLSAVNWIIFAMAENIFKDPQLMGLNMLILGAFAGITRSESGI